MIAGGGFAAGVWESAQRRTWERHGGAGPLPAHVDAGHGPSSVYRSMLANATAELLAVREANATGQPRLPFPVQL